ncbi:HAD superfamily phosphatase (TIGR01668 family) [Salibacterium salarium]|uniref:YqeG family HAD IIIA-type phosphatase n=1 Tax=Salibacterium salarium TaxID=284579 RepID=UPI00277FAC69|nr:YqeG family HAD IIIA-type phosphatase [Salibacterium salarium]MDQ0299784.1 HAD superfamily phosphatase (TIGR01668 family) [Salibacterium salarium]
MFKYFVPNEYLPSVYDLNLEDLTKRNIKGIITDLDNTLVEWDRPEATPELLDWMYFVKQQGFQVTIVSNNNKERVSTFSEPTGIQFIHSAKKPMGKAFRKACKNMGLKKSEVVVMGDQVLTDVVGGNRAGFYTVLVVPVGKGDGFFTKLNRKVERRVLSKLKRKGLIQWEE